MPAADVSRLIEINLEGRAEVVTAKKAAIQKLASLIAPVVAPAVPVMAAPALAFNFNRYPKLIHVMQGVVLADNDKDGVVKQKEIVIIAEPNGQGGTTIRIGYCGSDGKYAETEIDPKKTCADGTLMVTQLLTDGNLFSSTIATPNEINGALTRMAAMLSSYKSQSWVSDDSTKRYMDHAQSAVLHQGLGEHRKALGISDTDTGFFQAFSKQDFTDLQTSMAKRYAEILASRPALPDYANVIQAATHGVTKKLASTDISADQNTLLSTLQTELTNMASKVAAVKSAEDALNKRLDASPIDLLALTTAEKTYNDAVALLDTTITTYNNSAEVEAKIDLPAVAPAPSTPAPLTRGISIGGAKVEANIKGFLGKNSRDWVGKLLTDITRIKELKRLEATSGQLTVAAVSPPPQNPSGVHYMRVEKQERYIMSQTFQEAVPAKPGSHPIPERAGLLVQDQNGTVVNHSTNNLLSDEKEKTAIEMAQMFLRNYRPPKEIKITGNAENAEMAKMLHVAILKILPTAIINNDVKGGQPSLSGILHPSLKGKADTAVKDTLSPYAQGILKKVVEEVEPEVTEAQKKSEAFRNAQQAFKKANEGNWVGYGKGTAAEQKVAKEKFEEASKAAEQTGKHEGDSFNPGP